MNELLLFFLIVVTVIQIGSNFNQSRIQHMLLVKNTTNFSGFLVDFDEFLYFDHLNFK